MPFNFFLMYSNKGWQRVLLIIFPFFIVVGLFQYFAYKILGLSLTDNYIVKSSEQRLIIQSFSLLGTFILLYVFIKYVDKERFINIGLYLKNRFKDYKLGFIFGLIIMLIGFSFLITTNQIVFRRVNIDLKEIVLTTLIYSMVSFIEELFVRGYVLRNLMTSFDKYSALLLSSIFFSLIHCLNPNIDSIGLINLTLAGILLGISYIFTKNLWFPIALHLSWNLFQSFLGFNVSGINSYSIIEIGFHSETILNGGQFGFEGSILAIILQIVFIFITYKHYNKKHQKL